MPPNICKQKRCRAGENVVTLHHSVATASSFKHCSFKGDAEAMLAEHRQQRLVCLLTLFCLTNKEKKQTGGPFQGREHALCPWRHAQVVRRAGQIAPMKINLICKSQSYDVTLPPSIPLSLSPLLSHPQVQIYRNLKGT